MNIELIRKEISELLTIVEGWSANSGVADIERDIALDKIKLLYEQLRFATPAVAAPAQEPQTEMEIEDNNELEVEVELTYYEGEDEDIEMESDVEEEEENEEEIEDTEDEVEDEDEDEPLIPFELVDISIIPENEEVETEPEEEEIEEIVIEEPQREVSTPITPIDNALFDITTIPIRQKSRRSAILSLYSDDEPSTPSPDATPTPQPQTTPPAIEIVEEIKIEEIEIEREIIDESHTHTEEPTFVTTIADRYAEQMSSSNIASSSAPSSINDRYIISQELFAGDMQACEEMFEALEEIDNFDDGMIYIIENYDWNPDSEAAKLVVKLLEQRFLS